MKGLIFLGWKLEKCKIENIADVPQKYINNFFIQSKNQLFLFKINLSLH